MTYQCNLRAYLMQRDYEVSIENDVDLYNSGGKLFFPKPFLPTVDAGEWLVGVGGVPLLIGKSRVRVMKIFQSI